VQRISVNRFVCCKKGISLIHFFLEALEAVLRSRGGLRTLESIMKLEKYTRPSRFISTFRKMIIPLCMPCIFYRQQTCRWKVALRKFTTAQPGIYLHLQYQAATMSPKSLRVNQSNSRKRNSSLSSSECCLDQGDKEAYHHDFNYCIQTS
jgi:hypothetical protein